MDAFDTLTVFDDFLEAFLDVFLDVFLDNFFDGFFTDPPPTVFNIFLEGFLDVFLEGFLDVFLEGFFAEPPFNVFLELPLKIISRKYNYSIIPIDWKNRKDGKAKFMIKEFGSMYLFTLLYCLLEKILLNKKVKK